MTGNFLTNRLGVLPFAIALILCGAGANAQARTVEPGKVMVGGQLGFSSRMSGRLGAAGFEPYLMLDGNGEYAISSQLSAIGSLSFGLGRAKPLRLRGGAKYRITGLQGPYSPYGLAQLSFGGLFGALGANLPIWSLRVGIGVDYFVTAKLSAGALLAFDQGSTLGDYPARYGTWDILVGASYAL